jgi:hypothetical protein
MTFCASPSLQRRPRPSASLDKPTRAHCSRLHQQPPLHSRSGDASHSPPPTSQLMSTFKGIVAGRPLHAVYCMCTEYSLEFPQIRIDYFRQQPEFKAPLACFLSHVHSDHLVGLESMRAPFVYCSAATKEVGTRAVNAKLPGPSNIC